MEKITSRKNEYIQLLKNFNSNDQFVCCGEKMLKEAIEYSAEITSILWKDKPGVANCDRQYVAPTDLFDYVCPLKNSPGPIFTAKVNIKQTNINSAIVLENVQDPGNVGTVIRTANAFSIDAVYLIGDCASLHNEKTVRATMGAIFRQKVIVDQLPNLPIYAAVLAEDAKNINELNLKNCAVAIGSEGHGLSSDMISKCVGKVCIPMNPNSESLNAGVAASIFMWEMSNG